MLPDSMLEITKYMPYERFEIKQFLHTATDRGIRIRYSLSI